ISAVCEKADRLSNTRPMLRQVRLIALPPVGCRITRSTSARLICEHHKMEPVGHLGNTTEIGCDESGSEGEKLVGGNTDVFAHASVSLSIEAAAACVAEVRDRIRSPATEYKANHLLRDKHRAVLTWLLDPSGPLAGAAYVHLLDKPFFAVLKIVDTVLGHGRTDAVTLYRRGRVAVGDDLWEAFLLA